MKATAEAFVMGFNGGWRLDEVMAPRAPECTHETLPTSLGIPKKTNEEWAERFKHVLTLINDSKVLALIIIRGITGADAPADDDRRLSCSASGASSCL